MRRTEPERVYRTIAYGPLLDVFVLDMRSYRGPTRSTGRATPTPNGVSSGARSSTG